MAQMAKVPHVKPGLLIAMALAALPSLSRGDQPVATAKIAEWAASARGGRADYQELSHGQAVDLDSLACPGKITIVDFSSDYCAPCVQLAMYLIKISKNYPQRYAIRRVNINRPGVVGIDWQSPVSREFHLESIPRLVIYDNKVKVAEGAAARQWIVDDVDKMYSKTSDAQDDHESKKDPSPAPR
jgi:thiol-disulfide isomerase/thioredoxin